MELNSDGDPAELGAETSSAAKEPTTSTTRAA